MEVTLKLHQETPDSSPPPKLGITLTNTADGRSIFSFRHKPTFTAGPLISLYVRSPTCNCLSEFLALSEELQKLPASPDMLQPQIL